MATKRRTKSAKRRIKAATRTRSKGSRARSDRFDAIGLLKADHRRVEQLFAEYESTGSADDKRDLTRRICMELIVHTRLEEEIFYPACREKLAEQEPLDEAQIEHDSAKILIAELMNQDPDSELYDAKVSVLSEHIKHHVGEEERPSAGIFARARTAKVDMNALGQHLQARRQELLRKAETAGFRPPQPRALEFSRLELGNFQENSVMERRYGYERDDDRDDGRSRSGGRERDEYGRFMSDDDDAGSRGRSGSRGSSRYDDDDRRSRGGGRNQGGWFGDSEGHSEASRRGWEERGGYSRYSGRDDDDDDRGGSRGGGRSHGGWFGDPEGHSEASSRAWQRGRSEGGWFGDPDGHSEASRRAWQRGRPEGGWFGDPEGHSEASRRGWDERGGSSSRSASRGSSRYDDDDDRGGSRGSRGSSRRYDDDDDGRGSRGGRHGGWFGDSRGHAEAARRGWQNRD
jgi:hypothetical protein